MTRRRREGSVGQKRKRTDERWRKKKRLKTKDGEIAKRKENDATSPPKAKEEFLELTLQNKREEKRRKKEKVLADLKRKRKNFHERQREEYDQKLRQTPSLFLWEQYVAWAQEKLTNVEASSEQWKETDIIYMQDTGNTKVLLKQINSLADEIPKRKETNLASDLPAVETLAVSPAALRSVKLCKDLYPLGKKPVAKLFARHMKIDHQAKFLRVHTLVPVGVGTPNRLCALLDRSLMDLEQTKVFIIDCMRDAKLQSIFDIADTRKDLFSLIHKHARQYLSRKSMKIVLLAS